MDEFFQKLREIQKKERNLSGLAPVGENFYQNISKYFNILMRKIDNNPFSFESYLLRDAQRITAEICERREHKISNSAVMSVQRTYQLFKESEPDPHNTSKIPRNSTPEEEKLFHALVDSLISYREKMRGPLRFHNPQTKDKPPSNIPDNQMGNTDEEDSLNKVTEDEAELNTSKNNKDKDKNKGFTAEEEAAIEDDIYKQFGRESFPGSNLRENEKSFKNTKPLNSVLPNKSELSNENIEPLKNSPIKQPDNQNIQTDVLLVLEELPSIMGVDKKVYGPLLPQDIVTIPEPNARILIKNQKGKSIQKYK